VVEDLDDEGRVVERLSLRAVVGIGEVSEGELLRASITGDMENAEKLGASLALELLDQGGL
jgi:hydroxymethylbilane synthase